jgi:very-short-patch-repair endonuclease
VAEFVIPTKKKRSSGYPYHYKADLANPEAKLLVEVDGNSHYGKRKKLDEKKDALLASLGWSVFRFRN